MENLQKVVSVTKKKYKVYSLVCPKTNQVRYVGITYRSLSIRLKEHITKSKNSKKTEWINQLLSEGLTPKIKLIKDECTLEEAVAKEEALIKKYKDNLLNNLARSSINSFNSPSNTRKIYKCLRDGSIVSMYNSISEAAAFENLNIKGIRKCLSKERKTYKGFIWKYAEKRKLSHRTILSDTKRLVGQFKDDICVAIYKNSIEASKQTKINEKEILKCCNNRKKEVQSYTWQYIDVDKI